MLHWLKVVLLLVLTLIAMRLLSWGPMWILSRVTKGRGRGRIALCNALALALFAAFLLWQTLPGEPIDGAATAFGVVVYLVFSIADMFWLPWKESH